MPADQIVALGLLDQDVRRADPAGYMEAFRYLLPSDMEELADNTPGLPESVRREVSAAVKRGRDAIELDAKLRHLEGTYLLYDRQQDIRSDLDDMSTGLMNVRVPDNAMDVTAKQARRHVTWANDVLGMIKERILQVERDQAWNDSLRVNPEESLRGILHRYDLPRPDFTRADNPSLRSATDRPQTPARLDVAGL